MVSRPLTQCERRLGLLLSAPLASKPSSPCRFRLGFLCPLCILPSVPARPRPTVPCTHASNLPLLRVFTAGGNGMRRKTIAGFSSDATVKGLKSPGNATPGPLLGPSRSFQKAPAPFSIAQPLSALPHQPFSSARLPSSLCPRADPHLTSLHLKTELLCPHGASGLPASTRGLPSAEQTLSVPTVQGGGCLWIWRSLWGKGGALVK